MKSYFSGMFMIIFLVSTGAFAATAAIQGWRNAPATNSKHILQGKWAEEFEDSFNKNLVTYNPSLAGWGTLNYLLFKEGNDGVIIGQNDWLFTKEEFDYHPDKDMQVEEKLNFIAAVQDHLKKHNVRLVVVPVPAKARVYNAYLEPYHFPAYRDDIYKIFLAGLSSRGVDVVDTLGAMVQRRNAENIFLKTDTHWTPEGAKIVAKGISDYIHANIPDLDYQIKDFETVVRKSENFKGDLLRYVPTGVFSRYIGPEEDEISVVETIQKQTASAKNVEESLFSDDAPSVALVGTSYSANPRWNFAGFLKENLKTDILNAAEEGLGPFDTMKKYLDNEAFKSQPPELVIWEIPERYLPFKYDLTTDFYHHKGV